MNKIAVGLVVFMNMFTYAYGQKSISWATLSKVRFTEKYFPAYKETYLHPTFSSTVKALNGQMIRIKGYFLNLDPKGQLYMLSKGPMAACYFCGVGGPETAIELVFDTQQKLPTDTPVIVVGKLELNDSDIEHFNYILKNCKMERIKA